MIPFVKEERDHQEANQSPDGRLWPDGIHFLSVVQLSGTARCRQHRSGSVSHQYLRPPLVVARLQGGKAQMAQAGCACRRDRASRDGVDHVEASATAGHRPVARSLI